MSTTEFLLEVGTEEIPARMMDGALSTLKSDVQAWIKDHNLEDIPGANSEVRVYGTPRRLIVDAQLPQRQPDQRVTEKGPPVHVAYEEGNPTGALMGFCSEHGVSPDQVDVRDMDGGTYTVLELEKEGRSTMELIREQFEEVILGLDWPKAMRWEETGTDFIRPIRWAVAFFDGDPMSFSIGPVVTGTETRGLRFTSSERISVKGPADFYSSLKQAGVVYDQSTRRETIVERAKSLSEKKGGEPYLPEDLVKEVNYLVESPTPFVGSFDEEFLELPDPVLEEAMISHQKYFPVRSDDGLLPYFVGVRNGGETDLDIVREGNEKVIRARLSDAVFFYENDLETPFEGYRDQLHGVVFQEELGSLYDKTERMKQILKEGVNNSYDIVPIVKHCKNDHVTELVDEFPKLEGVMGRIYAEEHGWSPSDASVIEEHYHPRHREDELPESRRGQWLSVVDRIDTLVGLFGIGYRASGSSDPYGLRRDALGLLRTAANGEISVHLKPLITHVVRVYESQGHQLESDTVEDLKKFLRDRLYYLYRHVLDARDDEIRAVNNQLWSEPAKSSQRIQWLANWRDRSEYEDLYTTAQRIGNITKDVELNSPDPDYFEQAIEEEIWNFFQELQPKFNQAIDRGDSEEVLELLSSLRGKTDRFFEEVMVMCEDENLQRNRLALLRSIRGMFDRIADFTVLEQKK